MTLYVINSVTGRSRSGSGTVDILDVGVAVALVAWVITQVQLIRLWKRIGRAQEIIVHDIDKKRGETQTYVDSRLNDMGTRLEGILAAHTTHITSLIPPNPTGELVEMKTAIAGDVEALQASLNDFAKMVGEDMGWMKTQWGQAMGDRSAQSKQLVDIATAEGQRLGQELKAIGSAMPEDAMNDVRGQFIKTITREPTKKQREAMGPFGEMAYAAMRKGLFEFVTGMKIGGTNATYRINVPGGAGIGDI